MLYDKDSITFNEKININTTFLFCTYDIKLCSSSIHGLSMYIFALNLSVIYYSHYIDFANFSWLIADTALLALSFLFHLISAVRDPGYLQKPKDISFLVRDIIFEIFSYPNQNLIFF